MRLHLFAAAILALALGCANAYDQETNRFENAKSGQRDECNLAAAQRCKGAPDWDACMESQAGACDANVDNEVDPDQVDPIPPSLRDDAPIAEPGDAY